MDHQPFGAFMQTSFNQLKKMFLAVKPQGEYTERDWRPFFLFAESFTIQQETLERFYALAAEISPSVHPVLPPDNEIFSIKRNFFSTLFITVIRQILPETSNIHLYAFMNQGMRAWVTGCDNILDDEYKPIFDFLTIRGDRMRSVLTIMLAERVIQTYLLQSALPVETATTVIRTTYKALLPSAMQEGTEEARPVPVLPPDEIMERIHTPKTADLFAAPLYLPIQLESPPAELQHHANAGLRAFGLACQVLDDIRDFNLDLTQGRHNLACSVLADHYGQKLVHSLRQDPPGEPLACQFPDILPHILARADSYFEEAFHHFNQIGWELTPMAGEVIKRTIFHLLKLPELSGNVPSST